MTGITSSPIGRHLYVKSSIFVVRSEIYIQHILDFCHWC